MSRILVNSGRRYSRGRWDRYGINERFVYPDGSFNGESLWTLDPLYIGTGKIENDQLVIDTGNTMSYYSQKTVTEHGINRLSKNSVFRAGFELGVNTFNSDNASISFDLSSLVASVQFNSRFSLNFRGTPDSDVQLIDGIAVVNTFSLPTGSHDIRIEMEHVSNPFPTVGRYNVDVLVNSESKHAVSNRDITIGSNDRLRLDMSAATFMLDRVAIDQVSLLNK